MNQKQFADKIRPSLTGHALIAAPTGGGKSYLVGGMIERLYEETHPFVILDTKSLNHIGLWATKNKLKKVQLFRIFSDTSHDLQTYGQIIKNNPYLLFIPAGDIAIETLVEEYKKILKAIQLYKIPRHVVVEETHHYCKSAQKAIPEIEWIVREGRGYRIWLWSITQRIQSFPKDIWSNCNWTYLMHMRIPQDIKYITELIPEFPDINNQLQLHDVLQYDQLQKTNPPYQVIKADEVCRITKHMG